MNTSTIQWPLLISILAALGVENATELFEAARKEGRETETDAGLSVVTPDDDMSRANVRSAFAVKGPKKKKADPYLIFGQEAEDGSWWQVTFDGRRLESRDFSREALEAWETIARDGIGEVNFANPRDKTKALAFLDTVGEALTARLPADDDTDTSDSGCGD